MLKQKKGAIELSMTTIIVVIIGVILLGLAIGWITSFMGDIEGLTQGSIAAAEKAIQDQMPSGSKFWTSGYSFKTKAGKYSEIYSGLRFFDEDPEVINWFTLSVIAEDHSQENWFEFGQPVSAYAGETKGVPIGVKVPSNVAPGLYSFTLVAKRAVDAQGNPGEFSTYDTSAILIEVE